MAGASTGPILVVEDDPHVRQLIAETLAQDGHEVVEAGNAEIAVERAREHRPAAVVLDIGLPFVDGAVVADRIRDLYADVPIVAVTAGTRAGKDVSRVRAVAHRMKPFDIHDLVRAVALAIAPAPMPGGPEETAPGAG